MGDAPLGAEPAVLSLRGQQGAGHTAGSWQTCHARARRGSLGHTRSTTSPQLLVARTPRSLAFFRFVFHWSPLRLLWLSPRPLGNGTFHWRSGSPSSLCATFLLEERVKQLPRSAWLGWAGALILRCSAHRFPPPPLLPLPAPPPPHPHPPTQKLLRIGLSNTAHLLQS